MITEIGLGLSVVCAGLWSGLLLTLTTILHPMFATGDGAWFATGLGRFLPIARRSPTNYLLVMVCRIAWDHRGISRAGLAGHAVLCGCSLAGQAGMSR